MFLDDEGVETSRLKLSHTNMIADVTVDKPIECMIPIKIPVYKQFAEMNDSRNIEEYVKTINLKQLSTPD